MLSFLEFLIFRRFEASLDRVCTFSLVQLFLLFWCSYLCILTNILWQLKTLGYNLLLNNKLMKNVAEILYFGQSFIVFDVVRDREI